MANDLSAMYNHAEVIAGNGPRLWAQVRARSRASTGARARDRENWLFAIA